MKRSAWALADQAVVSLGTAISTVVLARTLHAADYGVFVLLFGLVLLANGLHGSLVTFPLSLRGAAVDGYGLRRVAGESLLLAALIALLLCLCLAAVVLAIGRPSLVWPAVGALAAWQLQETLRRALMAHLRHRTAIVGDAVRYLGQAIILVSIASSNALSVEGAFRVIATMAVAGSVVQWLQLHPLFQWPLHVPVLKHVADGRWVLLTNVVAVATVQAVPWTLSFFHGITEVARFGLLTQVLGLTSPVVIGIAGLIVPTVAAVAPTSAGLDGARRVAKRYSACSVALLVPYWGAIALFPLLAIGLFSGGNAAYADLTTPLRLAIVAYVMTVPAQLAQAYLNGAGYARLGFVSQATFSTATVLVSVPLASIWGVWGAVWGGIVPAAVYLASSLLMIRRTIIPPAAEQEDAVVRPLQSPVSTACARGVAR